MGSSSGPKLNNTDLKLYIDRDNDKSYIGRPITNFVSSTLSTGGTSFFSDHGSPIIAVTRTYNFYFNASRPNVIKWESTNTSGYTGFQIPSTQTCNSGSVYTVSFDIYWEKGDSVCDLTTNNFIIYGSAYKVPNDSSYADNKQARYEELGDGWRRYYLTYTATYTGTNYFRGNIYTNQNEDFIVYFDNIQFEEGYGSPWIEGGTTRSSTNVIKDLTNTATVTANNLDYAADTDQKYSFDGVDANLSVSVDAHPGTGDFSTEFVITHSDDLIGSAFFLYSVSLDMYFRGDWGGDLLWLLRRVTNSSYYGDSAWGYYTGIQVNIPVNTKRHIVLTSDASTLEFKAYVNGELVRTRDGTFDGSGNGGSPGALSSSNIQAMTIGAGGSYLDMDLELLKIYHRVLTADEIKTNFNSIKNRFGL